MQIYIRSGSHILKNTDIGNPFTIRVTQNVKTAENRLAIQSDREKPAGFSTSLKRIRAKSRLGKIQPHFIIPCRKGDVVGKISKAICLKESGIKGTEEKPFRLAGPLSPGIIPIALPYLACPIDILFLGVPGQNANG